MTFEDVLNEAVAMLQRQGRVSYRALKRQFALEDDYRLMRDGAWGGHRGYEAWFARDLNNAHLASIGAYHDLVPAFEALLDELHGDLEAFFEEVQRLASLSYSERRAALVGSV